MQFYRFSQNNSGGSFRRSLMLDATIFVEAANEDIAWAMLKSAGADLEDGCECCGPRWFCPMEWEGEPCSPGPEHRWPKSIKDKDFYAKVIYADMSCMDLYHDDTLREPKDHSLSRYGY